MLPNSGIEIATAGDAYRRRWMLFIDGENFAMEGKKVADNNGAILSDGDHYWRDVFLWMPNVSPTSNLYENAHLKIQKTAIRSHYYTALPGSGERLNDVSKRLRNLGFHPEVFWKEKGRRSKGVDITLTKDMLGHGYHGNYDVAVLWAGDEDYVPLVNEVKRMGKAVYVVFFERSCLDEELRLASDFCLDVEPMFLDSWPKDTAESK